MADEKKKLSTQDILAQARAQANSGGEPPAEKESSPPETESPAADAPTEAAPAAPKSTADILAAARAQKSAGDQADKPASAPKSTADILAAARAQKSAGEAPAAGAAPKSTADILAAARAQTGKAAAPAASGSASSKPAAKKAAAPVGDLPPVADMVKAVKGDVASTATATATGPKKPVIPTRPSKPAPKTEEPARRNFMVALLAAPFALAWLLLTLTAGGFVLAVARFMMPNVLVEPPSKFKIGPPSDYGFGTVATKWKSQFGVWIVHTEYGGKKLIYALASVCTHLGCTPNWLEGDQKFKCPCHGSGFYINGINFEGPAPRPLERVGLALGPDGMLEVDKSVKFQEEMGQWNDEKSYVVV